MATLARTSAQSERQRAAVEGSLGLAQDSADRGEYADALLWIHILEATGGEIPPDYEAKRQAWKRQLVATARPSALAD